MTGMILLAHPGALAGKPEVVAPDASSARHPTRGRARQREGYTHVHDKSIADNPHNRLEPCP
jgi:hypothetical protein